MYRSKETFNFTIDDVTYQAEVGMTWDEWIDSKYNVDKFTLTYNDEFKGIILTNKTSGKVWSNLNFDENNEPQATSTLNLSLQDMKIYQSVFKGGDAVHENGRISVVKVENGVEFTYYFDDVKNKLYIHTEKDYIKLPEGSRYDKNIKTYSIK